MTGSGPMYCPYGGGLCQHAAIERCGMQLSNLIECKAFWERIHASEQFDEGPPKLPSPPEMPEVDPHLTLGENGTTPWVLGYCVRFKVKRGKKEANSCVGCTVGCPGKGKQELDEGLEPQEPTDEQKELARLQRERMDTKL